LRDLRLQARRLAWKLGSVNPLTDDQFVQTYSGPKRTRYANAVLSLQDEPLIRRDGYVSAFVKAEKMDPGAKTNPDPRMIQSRSARYNVVVGKWLKAIEKKFYTITSPMGSRMVAKGLNNEERGELLDDKMQNFGSPVVYSIDGSRWDKHIECRVLDVEHSVYKKMVKDPEFNRALSWQRTNKVRTAMGVKYRTKGKRMSGDVNTSLGNCLLMCLMVKAAMQRLGILKWDCLDDGDDCLIIVETAEEWKLRRLGEVYLEFGQEIKLENRATHIEDVKFCQSQCIRVNGKWRFIREWRRCLSGDSSGVKFWGDPNIAPHMAYTIGCANLALYPGVPVLQEHGLALKRIGSGTLRVDLAAQTDAARRFGRDIGANWTEVLQSAAAVPISSESRMDFERAFGLSVDDQLRVESKLRDWRLDSWEPVKYTEFEREAGWVDQTHLDNLRPEI
jgi:hypothetical protein